MTMRATLKGWTAILLALNLSLVGMIWVTLRSEPSGSSGSVSTAAPSQTTAEPPGSNPKARLQGLKKYAAISNRPLFSQTRRPTKPPPPPRPEKKKTVPMNLVLLGVVIGEHEKLALIRSKNSAKLHHVPEGTQIEGWVVEKILPDYIVVNSEIGQTQVRLWRLKEGPGSAGKGPSKIPDKKP